ncbi:MAG: hypothetical protein WC354_06665, partial [Candidatus Omnitrophota bacterium]
MSIYTTGKLLSAQDQIISFGTGAASGAAFHGGIMILGTAAKAVNAEIKLGQIAGVLQNSMNNPLIGKVAMNPVTWMAATGTGNLAANLYANPNMDDGQKISAFAKGAIIGGIARYVFSPTGFRHLGQISGNLAHYASGETTTVTLGLFGKGIKLGTFAGPEALVAESAVGAAEWLVVSPAFSVGAGLFRGVLGEQGVIASSWNKKQLVLDPVLNPEIDNLAMSSPNDAATTKLFSSDGAKSLVLSVISGPKSGLWMKPAFAVAMPDTYVYGDTAISGALARPGILGRMQKGWIDASISPGVGKPFRFVSSLLGRNGSLGIWDSLVVRKLQGSPIAGGVAWLDSMLLFMPAYVTGLNTILLNTPKYIDMAFASKNGGASKFWFSAEPILGAASNPILGQGEQGLISWFGFFLLPGPGALRDKDFNEYQRLRKDAGQLPFEILAKESADNYVRPQIKQIARHEDMLARNQGLTSADLLARPSSGINKKTSRELIDSANLNPAVLGNKKDIALAKHEIGMRALRGEANLIKDYLKSVDLKIAGSGLPEAAKLDWQVYSRLEVLQPVRHDLAKNYVKSSLKVIGDVAKIDLEDPTISIKGEKVVLDDEMRMQAKLGVYERVGFTTEKDYKNIQSDYLKLRTNGIAKAIREHNDLLGFTVKGEAEIQDLAKFLAAEKGMAFSVKEIFKKEAVSRFNKFSDIIRNNSEADRNEAIDAVMKQHKRFYNEANNGREYSVEGVKSEGARKIIENLNRVDFKESVEDILNNVIHPDVVVDKQEFKAQIKYALLAVENPNFMFEPITAEGIAIKGKTSVLIPMDILLLAGGDKKIKTTAIFSDKGKAAEFVDKLSRIVDKAADKTENGIRTLKIRDISIVVLAGSEFTPEQAKQALKENTVVVTDINTLQFAKTFERKGDSGWEEVYDGITSRWGITDEIHKVATAPELYIGMGGDYIAQQDKYITHIKVAKDINNAIEKLYSGVNRIDNLVRPESGWKDYAEFAQALKAGKLIDQYSGYPQPGFVEYLAGEMGVKNARVLRDYADKAVVKALGKEYDIYQVHRSLINEFSKALSMNKREFGGYDSALVKKDENAETIFTIHPVHSFGESDNQMHWSQPEVAIARWLVGYKLEGRVERADDIIKHISISEQSIKESPATVLKDFKSFMTLYSATPQFAQSLSEFLGIKFESAELNRKDSVWEGAQQFINQIDAKQVFANKNYRDFFGEMPQNDPVIILNAWTGNREIIDRTAIARSLATGKKAVYLINPEGRIFEYARLAGGEKEVSKGDLEKKLLSNENIAVVFSRNQLFGYDLEITQNRNIKYVLAIDSETSGTEFIQAVRRNRNYAQNDQPAIAQLWVVGKESITRNEIIKNMVGGGKLNERTTEAVARNDAYNQAFYETVQESMINRMELAKGKYPHKTEMYLAMIKEFQSKHTPDDLLASRTKYGSLAESVRGSTKATAENFRDVYKKFEKGYFDAESGKTFRLERDDQLFFADWMKSDAKLIKDKGVRFLGLDKAIKTVEIKERARVAPLARYEFSNLMDLFSRAYRDADFANRDISSPSLKLPAITIQKEFYVGQSRRSAEKKLAEQFGREVSTQIARSYAKSLIDSMPTGKETADGVMFRGYIRPVMTNQGFTYLNIVHSLSNKNDAERENIQNTLLNMFAGSYNLDSATSFARTLRRLDSNPSLNAFYLAHLAGQLKIGTELELEQVLQQGKAKQSNLVRDFLLNSGVDNQGTIAALRQNGLVVLDKQGNTVPTFSGYSLLLNFQSLRNINKNIGDNKARVIKDFFKAGHNSIYEDGEITGFDVDSSFKIAMTLHEKDLTLSHVYNVAQISEKLFQRGFIAGMPDIDAINRIHNGVSFMNWLRAGAVKSDSAFADYLSKQSQELNKAYNELQDKLDWMYGYAHKTQRIPLDKVADWRAKALNDNYQQLNNWASLARLSKETGIAREDLGSIFNPDLAFNDQGTFAEAVRALESLGSALDGKAIFSRKTFARNIALTDLEKNIDVAELGVPKAIKKASAIGMLADIVLPLDVRARISSSVPIIISKFNPADGLNKIDQLTAGGSAAVIGGNVPVVITRKDNGSFEVYLTGAAAGINLTKEDLVQLLEAGVNDPDNSARDKFVTQLSGFIPEAKAKKILGYTEKDAQKAFNFAVKKMALPELLKFYGDVSNIPEINRLAGLSNVQEAVFKQWGREIRRNFEFNPDIWTIKDALRLKQTGCETDTHWVKLFANLLDLETREIRFMGNARPHFTTQVKFADNMYRTVDASKYGERVALIGKAMDEKGTGILKNIDTYSNINEILLGIDINNLYGNVQGVMRILPKAGLTAAIYKNNSNRNPAFRYLAKVYDPMSPDNGKEGNIEAEDFSNSDGEVSDADSGVRSVVSSDGGQLGQAGQLNQGKPITTPKPVPVSNSAANEEMPLPNVPSAVNPVVPAGVGAVIASMSKNSAAGSGNSAVLGNFNRNIMDVSAITDRLNTVVTRIRAPGVWNTLSLSLRGKGGFRQASEKINHVLGAVIVAVRGAEGARRNVVKGAISEDRKNTTGDSASSRDQAQAPSVSRSIKVGSFVATLLRLVKLDDQVFSGMLRQADARLSNTGTALINLARAPPLFGEKLAKRAGGRFVSTASKNYLNNPSNLGSLVGLFSKIIKLILNDLSSGLAGLAQPSVAGGESILAAGAYYISLSSLEPTVAGTLEKSAFEGLVTRTPTSGILTLPVTGSLNINYPADGGIDYEFGSKTQVIIFAGASTSGKSANIRNLLDLTAGIDNNQRSAYVDLEKDRK